MLEPTDEDRRIDPDVQIVADNLPALIAIRDACGRSSWRGEWHICQALLIELAVLVEGETPPASEAHRAAVAVLEEGEDEVLANEAEAILSLTDDEVMEFARNNGMDIDGTVERMREMVERAIARHEGMRLRR
jgi:hypothetical protein